MATDQLLQAQQQIHVAGKTVDQIARSLNDTSDWGTRRMAYLHEAIVRLNESWSLVRAASCNIALEPSVRPQVRDPFEIHPLDTVNIHD